MKNEKFDEKKISKKFWGRGPPGGPLKEVGLKNKLRVVILGHPVHLISFFGEVVFIFWVKSTLLFG